MVQSVLIFVFLLSVLVWLIVRAAREANARAAIEAQRDQAQMKAAQELYDLFTTEGDQPLPNVNQNVAGVILDSGEQCVALSHGARHIVTKRSTQVVGHTQGVSIRIAKGVRYHVGGFKGHPVVREYEVVKDTGSVYVTDKRLIFAGSVEVTSVPAAKIGDVHLEGARVAALVENRAAPLVIGITEKYSAPVIAAAAQRMAVEAHQQRPAVRGRRGYPSAPTAGRDV